MDLLQIVTEAQKAENLAFFEKFSLKFVIRLGIDLLTVLLIIRGIYYRHYRRTDLFLTFFSFNVIIFLITFLLNKVEMTMGAAFGLFAVFSMLRYRTENISAKDMTYIFIVIAIGLVMAISKGDWDELSLIGLIIVIMMALLESNWLIKRTYDQEIQYDRIELIQPSRREELLADLRERTGLNILRVAIGRIDMLKDSARITIYYQ
ncbi:MAG: DUF4956 domain-containing protein [Bacteroidota bacterium]